eukprot:COSAG01_NODE_2267_length_8037_cov_2.630054_7_plen_37_part_00
MSANSEEDVFQDPAGGGLARYVGANPRGLWWRLYIL